MIIARYTKKDFRIDTFNTGGPGGQNQNKREMGVRIVHLPSGLSAESRESRSQLQNKKLAFRRLAELIKKWHIEKETSQYEISKETIRTYHEPRNVVKDHASGLIEAYTEVVLNGIMDNMIASRNRAVLETVKNPGAQMGMSRR